MKNIITISGFIGSGKDTVAEYLVNNYNYERLSFASTLKDITAILFNWSRDLLEGNTTESREWREQPDKWWEEKLNMPNFTPRYALQYLGTDIFRQYFNTDIWVLAVENKLNSINGNVVITDCRFPNEFKILNQYLAKRWLVFRGNQPIWFGDAVTVNKSFDENKHLEFREKYKIHLSEYAWVGTEFNEVLDNSSTYIELYNQIDKIMCRI